MLYQLSVLLLIGHSYAASTAVDKKEASKEEDQGPIYHVTTRQTMSACSRNMLRWYLHAPTATVVSVTSNATGKMLTVQEIVKQFGRPPAPDASSNFAAAKDFTKTYGFTWQTTSERTMSQLKIYTWLAGGDILSIASFPPGWKSASAPCQRCNSGHHVYCRVCRYDTEKFYYLASELEDGATPKPPSKDGKQPGYPKSATWTIKTNVLTASDLVREFGTPPTHDGAGARITYSMTRPWAPREAEPTAAELAETVTEQTELPSGWKSAVDPANGKTFYWEISIGQSSATWNKPSSETVAEIDQAGRRRRLGSEYLIDRIMRENRERKRMQ